MLRVEKHKSSENLSFILTKIKKLTLKHPIRLQSPSFEKITELRSSYYVLAASPFDILKGQVNIHEDSYENTINSKNLLEGFGMSIDIKKYRWMVVQEVEKQDFVAMQFDATADQVSFDDATAIIYTKYNSNNHQIEWITFIGVGKNRRSLNAEYHLYNGKFVLKSLIFSEDINVFEPENKLDDYSLKDKSVFYPQKIKDSSNNKFHFMLYNPKGDDNLNNLNYWKRRGVHQWSQDISTLQYYGVQYSL